jgi:hypothetical protein
MAEVTPGSGRKTVERSAPGSGSSSGPKTISHLELATQGVADAAGLCILSLGVVPSGADWFIERNSVETDSILVSGFALYRDQVGPLYRKTATPAGNDDIEDCSSAIWFANGTNVLAVWVGCTPGANCFVNAQVRVEA